MKKILEAFSLFSEEEERFNKSKEASKNLIAILENNLVDLNNELKKLDKQLNKVKKNNDPSLTQYISNIEKTLNLGREEQKRYHIQIERANKSLSETISSLKKKNSDRFPSSLYDYSMLHVLDDEKEKKRFDIHVQNTQNHERYKQEALAQSISDRKKIHQRTERSLIRLTAQVKSTMHMVDFINKQLSDSTRKLSQEHSKTLDDVAIEEFENAKSDVFVEPVTSSEFAENFEVVTGSFEKKQSKPQKKLEKEDLITLSGKIQHIELELKNCKEEETTYMGTFKHHNHQIKLIDEELKEAIDAGTAIEEEYYTKNATLLGRFIEGFKNIISKILGQPSSFEIMNNESKALSEKCKHICQKKVSLLIERDKNTFQIELIKSKIDSLESQLDELNSMIQTESFSLTANEVIKQNIDNQINEMCLDCEKILWQDSKEDISIKRALAVFLRSNDIEDFNMLKDLMDTHRKCIKNDKLKDLLERASTIRPILIETMNTWETLDIIRKCEKTVSGSLQKLDDDVVIHIKNELKEYLNNFPETRTREMLLSLKYLMMINSTYLVEEPLKTLFQRTEKIDVLFKDMYKGVREELELNRTLKELKKICKDRNLWLLNDSDATAKVRTALSSFLNDPCDENLAELNSAKDKNPDYIKNSLLMETIDRATSIYPMIDPRNRLTQNKKNDLLASLKTMETLDIIRKCRKTVSGSFKMSDDVAVIDIKKELKEYLSNFPEIRTREMLLPLKKLMLTNSTYLVKEPLKTLFERTEKVDVLFKDIYKIVLKELELEDLKKICKERPTWLFNNSAEITQVKSALGDFLNDPSEENLEKLHLTQRTNPDYTKNALLMEIIGRATAIYPWMDPQSTLTQQQIRNELASLREVKSIPFEPPISANFSPSK